MSTTAEASQGRMPRQIPYIIGNEACERFSFYGMRNILVPFLISSVLLAYLPEADRDGKAKDIFHTFVIGVYFFPLLGGWLSDRFFGTSMFTRTYWSPRPRPFRAGTPLSRRRNTVPLWVPSGTW